MTISRRLLPAALSLACAATIFTGTASAVDRSVDTEHARQSAEALKSELDRRLHGHDAHYVRTWVDYCIKTPERGGCETVLRRLKQASPQAQTMTELQSDTAADVRDGKAR
jgi:hypothetical protein